jgi:splicing factor 3A subunit 1
MSILNRAGERFEFDLNQSQAKKKKEELDEEERSRTFELIYLLVQMAQIDWNDFVVVETIDLFDHEELPAPNDFSSQKISAPESELAKRAQINDPSGFSNQLLPSSIPSTVLQQIQPEKTATTSVPSAEADIKVKKDFIRKPESKDNSTTKCPNCGQYIPVSEFNEHYRIEMLHPNYKKIKDEVSARAANTTMVSGDEISQNLGKFAQHRPDLFGDRPKTEQDEASKYLVIFKFPKTSQRLFGMVSQKT